MNEPLQPESSVAQRYWNPYVAGVGLGLTLLVSFVALGVGLGASGSTARLAASAAHAVAPAAVESNGYLGSWFAQGSPLANYLVFMTLGTLVGGLLSALFARRIQVAVERGPRISAPARIVLALIGGLFVGFASRMAAGCTSGQALTGSALLLAGSWAFLVSLFVGGYLVAPLVRRQWTS
ncbi:MAG: YeeE/YedE family protein [Planctomycetes bacterium]|nr:YeeE/YedE family protein [Planctomycetota bacterium]